MVLYGIDRIDRYAQALKGRRIGLITSPSGVDASLRSTIDILHERFSLTALFSPEHGVRGNVEAGGLVDTYADPATGVPVYSLYRRDSKRFTPEMLENVDLVAYDIQDVGARYYTFLSTLLFAMEDCAKADKELVVFDRPDPLDGVTVEGNTVGDAFHSFVGAYPLCMRYGLSIGEFARMANDRLKLGCRLTVIPCEGWRRKQLFPQTGRVWVPPTMGIPRFETALLYPGMCLFEGTNLSEGRGTAYPFEITGAPFIDDAPALAQAMNEKHLSGVAFRPVYFKPTTSKHSGVQCGGVQVHVLDAGAVRAVRTGVELLFEIRRRWEKDFAFLPPFKEGGRPFIDLLGGTDALRGGLADKDALLDAFAAQSEQFAREKQAYHLYE